MLMKLTVGQNNFSYCYSYSQLHQHFMRSFCSDIPKPYNYKAKLYLEKSSEKPFCMKKLLVKFW